MRTVVVHLTRNIVINPSKSEGWGCRILTSKYTDTIRDINYNG